MGCLNSKPNDSSASSYEASAHSITSSLLDGSHLSSSIAAPTLVTETDAILIAASFYKDNEALPDIGGRRLKWHYLVHEEDKDISMGKKKAPLVPMVMALTYLRPDRFPIPLTSPATLEVFCTLTCGLDNPYLFPLESAAFIRDRQVLVATRRWTDTGSLRDLVHGKQRPKHPYSQKYARCNGRPLSLSQVQTYGRHILEGLKALNAKGIVADCLTSGNVLVHNKVARISDLENTLLGGGVSGTRGAALVEVLMESTALALEQDRGPCPFDVQLFGLVLLEMSTGAPAIAGCFMQEVADEFCERSFPSGPPCVSSNETEAVSVDSLRALLADIFVTHEATVDSLLAAPFFASVSLPLPSSRLKLSSAEKGLVKSAMKVSHESRQAVLSRIQQGRAEEEDKRQQRQRDAEETMALAAMNTAEGGGTDSAHSRRVQVLKRQSFKRERRNVGGAAAPLLSSNGANGGGASSSSEVDQRSDTGAGARTTVADKDAAASSSNTVSSSLSTGVPDKYQKLLNIGLHQDQVKHKMIQDGFDPSAIGW